MNAVIACGGTGGHLFPGLAVAEILRARGHQVLLFISEKEIDSVAVAEHSEFQFEKLPTIGLPSPFSPAILAFLRRFNDSLARCRSIYRNFNPTVVLGMGGFTSTAPVLAGRFRGIPTFVHESNAYPGKANRITARFVRAVLLGFRECAPFFPTTKTEVTGTPIRADLKRIERLAALEKLGLEREVPTLLVMGGSQGASGINQAIIRALAVWKERPAFQIIHLTGGRDEQLVADNYRRENIRCFVAAFHHRMAEVYSAAGLVIARAGAASLAEISAFAIPALLIPYPYAADDHQTRNAEIYVRAGAALMLKESEIGENRLAQAIRDLIGDAARLGRMSASSASLAPTNAAELVADTMERYTQGQP